MGQTFKVPIRNLYCLLSYMNDMPEFIESMNDVDEDLITYDFIAKQFVRESEKLINRGLLKDYVVYEEETNRLSGRLLMDKSLPFIMTKKPLVVCEKDEYSENVLFNQIMKAILLSICRNRYVKEATRRQSFKVIELLVNVDNIELTGYTFSKIYFNRHSYYYSRLIHLAKLMYELILLSHRNGNWSLFNANLDEHSLNRIFEKFLFHFYRIEQEKYVVSSERMKWKLIGDSTYLPSMLTDISLTHKLKSEKIVMDAKFYKNMFQENYGKSSFHSHNLYQLFTYLMHQNKEQDLRGILIYPFNGTEIDTVYKWSDSMTIEIMTINMDNPWKDIRERLLNVVD